MYRIWNVAVLLSLVLVPCRFAGAQTEPEELVEEKIIEGYLAPRKLMTEIIVADKDLDMLKYYYKSLEINKLYENGEAGAANIWNGETRQAARNVAEAWFLGTYFKEKIMPEYDYVELYKKKLPPPGIYFVYTFPKVDCFATEYKPSDCKLAALEYIVYRGKGGIIIKPPVKKTVEKIDSEVALGDADPAYVDGDLILMEEYNDDQGRETCKCCLRVYVRLSSKPVL